MVAQYISVPTSVSHNAWKDMLYKHLILDKAEQKYWSSAGCNGQLSHTYQLLYITSILTPAGVPSYDSFDILTSCHPFYSGLFRARCPTTPPTALTDFLQSLNLPRLSPADRKQLNAPIYMEELALAVDSLPTGKAPGTDGFPSKICKMRGDVLYTLTVNGS